MMRLKATIEVEIEGDNLDDIVLRAALFKGVSEMEKVIKSGILGGWPNRHPGGANQNSQHDSLGCFG